MIKKHENTITMDGFISQDLELSHLSDKDHRKTKPIPSDSAKSKRTDYSQKNLQNLMHTAQQRSG